MECDLCNRSCNEAHKIAEAKKRMYVPAPVCPHVREFEGNDEKEGRKSAIYLLKPGSLHNMHRQNLVRSFVLGTMMHKMMRRTLKFFFFFYLHENISFQDHNLTLHAKIQVVSCNWTHCVRFFYCSSCFVRDDALNLVLESILGEALLEHLPAPTGSRQRDYFFCQRASLRQDTVPALFLSVKVS